MIQDQPPENLSPSNYYQENDLTGGLPINLDSLRYAAESSSVRSQTRFHQGWTPRNKAFLSIFNSNPVRCLHQHKFPFFLTHMFYNSYAIKGSPNQKLLLEDIYYAIESRVRQFRSLLTPDIDKAV